MACLFLSRDKTNYQITNLPFTIISSSSLPLNYFVIIASPISCTRDRKTIIWMYNICSCDNYYCSYGKILTLNITPTLTLILILISSLILTLPWTNNPITPSLYITLYLLFEISSQEHYCRRSKCRITDFGRVIYSRFIFILSTEGALRLADGVFDYQGVVQIFHGDEASWGLVCNKGWDFADAEVACRQLGKNNWMVCGYFRGGFYFREFHESDLAKISTSIYVNNKQFM